MSASFIFANGLVDPEEYQEYNRSLAGAGDTGAEEGGADESADKDEAETEAAIPNPEKFVDALYIHYVALKFADGSTYVVLSDDPENLIDNTNYVCAGLGAESEYSTYMFNRLVDWS